MNDQRLVGRLQRGRVVVEAIPFSIEGCESVKTPNWARRATVRGMPPAAGQNNRRVELKSADTSTRGCTIAGVFSPRRDLPRTTTRSRESPGMELSGTGGRAEGGQYQHPRRKADPDNPNMIQVQVYNAGPGNAIATEVKLFYTKDGKVTNGKAVVPAVPAKTSVWVAVGAGLPISKADSVSARVDNPNKVSETNELNNSYKFK